MSTAHVRTVVRDHVARVVLDRPPVNALTPDVLEAIGAAFGSFAGDGDVRVAVLASAVERAFCAGADIKASLGGGSDDPPAIDPGARGRNALWSLYDCAVPVIAAVNGPALGGGLALVSCCDIIVASERAVFGLPEIDVGLLGGGSHLQRMIGPHRMRHAFFTGRRISAAEMLALGAISMVVPHADLDAEVDAIAADIERKSPAAVRLAKEAFNRVEHLPLKEAYRIEQDYTNRLARFEDSREAMAAFVERREPRFRGR